MPRRVTPSDEYPKVWADPAAGLWEMARVAAFQVILTVDQDRAWLNEFWLTRDYLPQQQFREPCSPVSTP
jgi:hypothetical protein